MSPWKVILATMIIFGCGVVTGGLLTKTVLPAVVVPPGTTHPVNYTNQPPPLGQLQRPEFLRRMEKQLDLTPAQRDEIVRILRESQERTRKDWELIAPQLREEFKQVRSEIRQTLNNEQKRKWDELLKSRPHKENNIVPNGHSNRPLPNPQSNTNSL